MKKFLLSTVAIIAIASSASAADVSGEVTLDFAETASSNWAGTFGLELDVVATETSAVTLGFTATPGGDLNLDTWTVGTALGGVELSFGNDNSVFVEAEGEQTIAAPAMTESLKIALVGASFAVGFTDWTADITDVSNVQGAYTLDMGYVSTTVSGDYNMDNEDFVVGAAVSGVNLGALGLGTVVTYDNASSDIGYEVIATVDSFTAYVNGNDTDAFQNLGAEYVRALGGVNLTSAVVYNIDAEEFTPTIGLAFAF